MMKNTVEVLHVVANSGTSKKTGNDYDMRMAQCIVHKPNRETGVVEPLVGELLLPKQFFDIPRGLYEVEFEVSIARDKRIGSQVFSMTPLAAVKPVPAAPISKAA